MAQSKHNARQLTAIIPTHQLPLLEYFDNRWHVWLSYDKTKTQGTYLSLLNNGTVMRMTVDADTIKNVVTITPKET